MGKYDSTVKMAMVAVILFELAVVMTMTGRGGGNFYVLTLVLAGCPHFIGDRFLRRNSRRFRRFISGPADGAWVWCAYAPRRGSGFGDGGHDSLRRFHDWFQAWE